MLGRGDLRLLHPLPQRGPLGAAPHLPQADAQLPPPDAPARARTCWATATTRTRVVDRFVDKSAENGMDVFRVFDAPQRHAQPASARWRPSSRTGKHAEGTICYTVSPLHTVEKFVEMAQQLKDMGCDSICIKDMAALLRPQPAYDIVKGIKETCGKDTLVHVHVHSTTGVTLVSLMKAIEAGRRHRGHLHLVAEPRARATTRPRRWSRCSRAPATPPGWTRTGCSRSRTTSPRSGPRYAEFESKIIGVETEIFDSQIPGGMISNMESQLKQQGAGDRVKEVLAEVPKRPQGRRLPAAGHAVQPDRRHPGRASTS